MDISLGRPFAFRPFVSQPYKYLKTAGPSLDFNSVLFSISHAFVHKLSNKLFHWGFCLQLRDNCLDNFSCVAGVFR